MKTVRIYARKCAVEVLDETTAQAFIKEHHRQGSVRVTKTTLHLGLTFKGVIVAVIQFAYPSTEVKKRKYTTELLRMAFRSDYRVVGGASKLVSHYIKTYSPADFFTYQDMRGEASPVYEHCGMILVSQSTKKDYLVAPGKTLDTATRREALGMAYATRFGPDRILGSKLGEQFWPDGTRKTNKDIFLHDLGWHLETAPGDRVYEWINIDRTYYTYKISASDSDKYYYGVSHVKKGDASIEDCLLDGYFGSGGASSNNKLSNWKKKHRNTLTKEVLGLFTRKAEAFQHESELVGTSWQDDVFCLNSCPGGRRSSARTAYPSSIRVAYCETHGDTKHRKNSCIKCAAAASQSQKHCDKHGEGWHQGETCRRCSVESRLSIKYCAIHGEASHQGSSCLRCSAAKSEIIKTCSRHGLTLHTGNSCRKCAALKVWSLQHCVLHGETQHRGEKCERCAADVRVKMETCSVHGETLHQGATCAKCSSLRNRSMEICENHGLVWHHGGACLTCRAESGVTVKTCESHGEVTFIGDKCRVCVNNKSVSTKFCAVHGETKHQGDSCSRCNAAKVTSEKVCKRHGATKHQGEKCGKCTGMVIAHKRFHATPNPNCFVCFPD